MARLYMLIGFVLRLCPLHRRRFACADPGNFVRGCPTLTMFWGFFLVDEGWVDANSTISGPSSARQLNSKEFRWRADDGPTLNAA